MFGLPSNKGSVKQHNDLKNLQQQNFELFEKYKDHSNEELREIVASLTEMNTILIEIIEHYRSETNVRLHRAIHPEDYT